MTDKLEISIMPINEDYDPSDDRWLDQVSELVNDLQQDVGKVSKEVQTEEGKKGGVEILKMILDSKDIFSAAADAFKTWISRDQKRELEISIQRGKKTLKYRVSSNRMDKDDIRNFMEMALKS